MKGKFLRTPVPSSQLWCKSLPFSSETQAQTPEVGTDFLLCVLLDYSASPCKCLLAWLTHSRPFRKRELLNYNSTPLVSFHHPGQRRVSLGNPGRDGWLGGFSIQGQACRPWFHQEIVGLSDHQPTSSWTVRRPYATGICKRFAEVTWRHRQKEFGTKKGSKLFQGLEYSFPLLSSTFGASQMAPVVKNSHVNAGDIRDVGSISGLATLSSIFAWRIPWIEEDWQDYSPMDWQATVHRVTESDMTEVTWHACMRALLSKAGFTLFFSWWITSIQWSVWCAFILNVQFNEF